MAINSGHDGTIMLMHAQSVRDALARLEVYMLENNPSVPVLAIREQMTAAIDIIVNQHRLRDGVRRMTQITEVMRLENGVPKLQDIFHFEQTGYENGRISGHFSAAGNVPHCLSTLEGAGVSFPENFFTPKA